MNKLIAEIKAYLERFVVFATPDASTVAALWVIGTYFLHDVDTYPYLVITSSTKRAGKTRLSELLGFMSCNPRPIAGVTAAALFRMIAESAPTLIIDEAEDLQSESARILRTALNVGYRRGQTIPRAMGTQVVEWPMYCAKMFVLIGDVYDTLRDRSITMFMQRAERDAKLERFTYTAAQEEGNAIGEKIKALVEEQRGKLLQRFVTFKGLPFLGDRDEEIWTPLFVIAEHFGVDIDTLARVAVDMSTEKTAIRRTLKSSPETEQAAQDDEYAVRLLADMRTAIGKDKYLTTVDMLERLKAMPLAPWRKYRGEGLTVHTLASMVKRFGLAPKNIRLPGGRSAPVVKGYKKQDIDAAK